LGQSSDHGHGDQERTEEEEPGIDLEKAQRCGPFRRPEGQPVSPSPSRIDVAAMASASGTRPIRPTRRIGPGTRRAPAATRMKAY
jgi:hypothetical protein